MLLPKKNRKKFTNYKTKPISLNDRYMDINLLSGEAVHQSQVKSAQNCTKGVRENDFELRKKTKKRNSTKDMNSVFLYF